MADTKKLGNSVKGENKDGWRVYRQEKRKKRVFWVKLVLGIFSIPTIIYPLYVLLFALPG